MREIDEVVERFRSAGLKITPQRMSIFGLIKDNRTHPSAEDIFRKALALHPCISFTTVYKTLQTLRDLGEVRELTVDPERAHFDPVTEDHLHAFCTVCRGIHDYPVPVAMEEVRSSVDGFEVRQVDVSLTGVCRACQAGKA